ncbi:hypothetical protein ABZW49_10830 [Nonomuraea wenchangensis]
MTFRNILHVVARPAVHEVAIVALQPGERVRVLHTAGVRDYTPDLPDVAYFAVVPGHRETLGWGWQVGWYMSLTRVRNGHHDLDRDAWHAATRALQRGGVAYVSYVQRLYYGEPRWTANGYRWEPAVHELVRVRLAEKAEARS